jgi:hypothetical protein
MMSVFADSANSKRAFGGVACHPYSILYHDEVRASPAAKPLPGILQEQDRPVRIHDNAGVLRTIS